MSPQELLAETVRVEGRRVLATLVRTLGSLQLAEDAVQDAVVAALATWPRTGVPDDPRAWLTVAARRKAYDVLRREAARPAKEDAAGRGLPATVPDPAEEAIVVVEPGSTVRDDLLRLVFTCCHPALAREAQVALALRTLAGLDVPAIARAFLVPETTMAKRLVRARRKIATAGIPYRVPADTELPARLPAVLAVVHLIATEAHAPTGGDEVVRVDLEAEAVRLARLLAELMPGEPEVLALLALLLLTAARRPARTGPAGEPVLLADQDRSRWDAPAIREGSALLAEAVRRRAVPAAGPPRRLPLDGAELGGDRLGPGGRLLRPDAPAGRQPGGRAQPGGRRRRAGRPGGRPGRARRDRPAGAVAPVARGAGGGMAPARRPRPGPGGAGGGGAAGPDRAGAPAAGRPARRAARYATVRVVVRVLLPSSVSPMRSTSSTYACSSCSPAVAVQVAPAGPPSAV